MRYLVKARLKPGLASALLRAIQNSTLGQGSVAGEEYLRDMQNARVFEDGTTRWVEICFCSTPLQEERPYWEEYFEFVRIQDAHDRRRCRDKNGSDPWACIGCDCSQRLEEKLTATGASFLAMLRRAVSNCEEPAGSR
jgi:hypothetical protein